MPGKKDKKNAKDSGGVVAAVTKHNASKFPNGIISRAIAPSPSPTPGESPEIAATTPSSNGNPTTSPVLEAVSATSIATSATPSTHEWTRGVPGMAGSPGNLISLTGESPPSSYEDPRGVPYGWPSPRPFVNSHPASVSPPSSIRRPLSFQLDAQYQSPDLPPQPVNPAIRRSSLHSHFAQSRGTQNPPLPHLPQAHFYTAPDIDFDLQPQCGMKAGERGYYFGFDNLPAASGDTSPGRDHVVLAGYEGGLEVHSVGKRGLEHMGSLKGLRGGVYHAKILPWISTVGGSDVFPLVVLVVHGPVLPAPCPDITVAPSQDEVSNDTPAGGSPAPVDAAQRDTGGQSFPAIQFYQTSVEVYSLKNHKRVGTLLETPKILLKMPITSPIFKAPPPTGALHVRADGETIVVSSGVTGECWVYRQGSQSNGHGLHFKCVGKLWTTLQQPLKGDATQDADRGRVLAPSRQRPQSAILALSGRWVAYCPATPSSQIALRAAVPVPVHGRAPGLSSMTPPQLPPVNSEVDLPISESVMNKIMRDATQELIQGAKWVGQQGLQAWNNYWKGPSPLPQPSRSPTLGSQPWGGSYSPRQEQSQFPPTHGALAPAVSKEPGLISVLDVETLGNSASLHPIITFSTPLGCSFLSFSPTGLSIFTASSKGDVQTVWDLMRVQYTKASPLQTSTAPTSITGPRVRQVAQFSRMTVARIVDISWTKPNGERIAMVTERGTVHLLDMPSSAFVWPPPRRRSRSKEPGAQSSEGTGSTIAMASSALSSAIEAARPLIARPRRSSSNVPQFTGSSIVDTASHGGKVIAASISHSLGKTGNAINQLRHTGENRVSLPHMAITPGPSCVVWINGRKHHSLFVIGDGLVRTFPNKNRKTSSGVDQQRTLRLTRYKDFAIPSLPDEAIAPAVKQLVEPDEYLDLTEKDLDAANTLVLDPRVRLQTDNLGAESSIPQAEIESSAPYQPFHTDRRVGLYAYGASSSAQPGPAADVPPVSALLAETSLEEKRRSPTPRKQLQLQQQQQQLQQPQASPSPSPSPSLGIWAFGLPIPATRLDVGLPPLAEDESFGAGTVDSRALPASAMERVLQHVGDGREQIVVTTRRRRGAGRAPEAEDDGFFEDDCEVLDFADQRV